MKKSNKTSLDQLLRNLSKGVIPACIKKKPITGTGGEGRYGFWELARLIVSKAKIVNIVLDSDFKRDRNILDLSIKIPFLKRPSEDYNQKPKEVHLLRFYEEIERSIDGKGIYEDIGEEYAGSLDYLRDVGFEVEPIWGCSEKVEYEVASDIDYLSSMREGNGF